MLLLPGSSTRAHPRRGSTLILSLLATVVVVSLSAIFLQLTSSIAKRQSQSADQKRSFYLAEAGLAEAFAGLRSGKSGAVGSEAQPALYGNGLFWVTSTDLGDGLLSLESTGMCGTTLSSLDIVVSKGEASVAALGVFSGGDLAIPSGSSITSFDSGAVAGGAGSGFGGPRQTQLTNSDPGSLSSGSTLLSDGRMILFKDIGQKTGARVSSNGNISIDQAFGASTSVQGDLRPGVNGTLTVNGTPLISGSRSALASPVKLPAVTVPVYALGPGYVHSNLQPLVLPPTNGSFQNLKVQPGSELTITAPSSLVINRLVVSPGARIIFDTSGGAIDIYITTQIDLSLGSYLDVIGNSALSLSIQMTALANANLRATGDFYGSLYAPASQIKVGSNFHVFGSVVASQLAFDGPCHLSFDAALGRAAEQEALPILISWRILEMNPIAASNGNPFSKLGLTREALLPPNESHRDQILEIHYVDSLGIESNYSGWESDFAWSSVGQVLNISRDGAITGGIDGLASIGGTGDGTGLIGNGDHVDVDNDSRQRRRGRRARFE